MSLINAIKNAQKKTETPAAENHGDILRNGFGMRFVQFQGGNANYKVPSSGFAVSTSADSPKISPNTIASCREVFANSFKQQKSIFFNAGSRGKVTNLVLYFRVLENKLGLKPEERTAFEHTSSEAGTVHVIVSDWWTKSNLRKQAFTILLRCGTAFHGDFDAANNTVDYFKQTKAAFQMFFDGHNKPARDIGMGWVQSFNGKTKADVEKILLK